MDRMKSMRWTHQSSRQTLDDVRNSDLSRTGLVALALTRTLPRGSWWAKAAALGVLNIGLFFPFLFIAAERLPGGVAATLGAAQPLVVALLAIGVLKENASAWRLAWGVIG